MTSEPGVLARYQALIDDGTLAPDPAQHAVAARLDDLAARLEGYKPAARRGGWFGRWTRSAPPPTGLYIHGDVGRGKSR
ncbi:MAG: AFG1/ZapE family ATPase, partial [Pseudomonadota bacterium]|nr:AFG1/ZapE family ATPase [Pseudomonadota bacterium]